MNAVVLLAGQRHRSSSSMCGVRCVIVQFVNTLMALLAIVMFYVIIEGDKRRRVPGAATRYSTEDIPFAFESEFNGESLGQLADLQKQMEHTKREVQDQVDRLQLDPNQCHLVQNRPAKANKRKCKDTSKEGSGGQASCQGTNCKCPPSSGPPSPTPKAQAKKSSTKARRAKKKAQLSV